MFESVTDYLMWLNAINWTTVRDRKKGYVVLILKIQFLKKRDDLTDERLNCGSRPIFWACHVGLRTCTHIP